MINSIRDVVNNDLCISCGACTFLSEKGNDKMQESLEKGVYLPPISAEVEKAFDICPGKGYEIEGLANELFPDALSKNIDLGRWKEAYTVHSNVDAITEHASSGGIMVGIAQYLLENKVVNGVLTTRFHYGENGPRPESFIATNMQELIESQGSKYCPVPVFDGLTDIKNYEGKLLFIGTPCQIAGLRMLQKKNNYFKEKILLTIGNFCGGYRDLRETDKIIKRANFEKTLITKFRYRGNGQPGFMQIEDKKGNNKSLPYPNYARMTGVVKYLRCRVCVDATAELADFSCGDAWIPKYLKSGKAWSIVIARSSRATMILDELADRKLITRESVSIDDIKRSQRGNLTSKKDRQQERMKLYRILGYKLPLFDGGYHENNNGLLLELKVHVSHTIFSILEKVGMYKVFSKIIGRYPKGL